MKKIILFSSIVFLSACIGDFSSGGSSAAIYGYRFDKRGRDRDAPTYNETYTKLTFRNQNFELLQVPIPTETFSDALKLHEPIFNNVYGEKKKEKPLIKSIGLTYDKLKATFDIIQQWNNTDSLRFFDLFDLYKLKGKDQKGGMQFTGYFTPVFRVSTVKDTTYRYPISKVTKLLVPKNDSTDEKEVKHHLQIVYTKSENAVASIRLQGSGVIQYFGGKIELLNYSPNYLNNIVLTDPTAALSTNTMISYKGRPKGAGLVPLSPSHSVAVDPRYIPLGSCLLAAIPILNERGQFTHHEFRIVLAQDTGGAIKKMRIDLYFGTGERARQKASLMKHYGRMWLLVAK